MTIKILRLHAVLEQRGRSRSSHYADIKAGLFIEPVLIGLRAVGWPDNEVDTLNAARISGMPDEEIRKLVIKLDAARKTAALGAMLNANTPVCA
jgi:prophage regulatory protein